MTSAGADQHEAAGRPVPPVRHIGEGVPYLDGAEQQLLEVMRTAGDVSSGSDELNDHIVDWPTRYHLSHQRANLLRPLQVRPGARVLDVGAGTGSLARYLGEQGADVVALEGSTARAKVAAVRCSELPNVEVLCGSIDDLDAAETFDLVTIIGVLEYSAAAIGGAEGPAHLLDAARRRLRPGGVVALAIENQLGLKYLLGGAEDHHGVPWVGLEDYPGPRGARTWSRRELRQMLAAAGLSAQHWLYPFPDYKLPSIVVDEQLFAQPDAAELVDQLVLRPVSFLDTEPTRLADAPAAFGVLVRAGLGPDVASSFLVVAGCDDDALRNIVDPEVLAWIDGNHRRAGWRRHRVLTTDRRVVVRGRGGGDQQGWLRQEVGDDRPFEPGQTLGQLLQQHLRSHDLSGVTEVLDRWWGMLQQRSSALGDAGAGDAAHPFIAGFTERVLPDGYLDVSPSNFVDRDGDLVLVDDEWRVGGPVDLHLVTIRALWVLSQEVVTSGLSHPWDLHITVAEVFDRLCEMIDLHPTEAQRAAFEAAELELQQLVAGGSPEHLRAGWLNGERRGIDVRPDVQLVAERDALRHALAVEQEAHRANSARLEADNAELRGQLAHYDGLLAERDATIEHLRTPRGIARSALATSSLLRRIGRRLRG